MRIMPFMKRKNGVQFAGVGLDTGDSGGGGGGGGSSIEIGTTPTKIGKYKGSDLYAVAIPVPGDITASSRSYIETEFDVDTIVTLSARYNYVLGDEVVQGVDGTLNLYAGVGAIVGVCYQYYEQKDCFVYAVSQLKSGGKLTDFEIIAIFTKQEV